MNKGRRTYWKLNAVFSKGLLFCILSLLILGSSVAATSTNTGTNTDGGASTTAALTEADALRAMNTVGPNIAVNDIQLQTSDSGDYYQITSQYTTTTRNGDLVVHVTSKVDATGSVTTLSKRIRCNTDEIIEDSNELYIINNNKLTAIPVTSSQEKAQLEKMVVNAIEPLVDVNTYRQPMHSYRYRYTVQVRKNSDLAYKSHLITTDSYEFNLIETTDLTPYLSSDDVIKICRADGDYYDTFVEYAKTVLESESGEKIRQLELQRTHLDVTDFPQLKEYLEDDGWDVQPGQTSMYQQFVTPETATIIALTDTISSAEDAYNLAVQWTWVADSVLNKKEEKWLKPEEFLTNTPGYASNPIPGSIVSDCSEQANTLVSLLRAIGISAEDVRVVLGEVDFDGSVGGHAWVEFKVEGKWLVLDPTCGPYWDEETNQLVSRDGVGFNYWRNHAYPSNEIWAYYNDVYYTDESQEVAEGWSNPYQVFTEADLYAGLITEASMGFFYIVIVISALILISVISSYMYNKKDSGKM